ncbi:MAG: hypothetical protein JW828_04950 [Sedimentisphaerales bacterium]|nr:hypothetical protein [Sedimentisphaerales bacterium]
MIRNWRICIVAAFVFILTGWGRIGAVSTSWQNTGTGNWSAGINWSGGVPDSSTEACVQQGVAQITNGNQWCQSLFITGGWGLIPEVHLLSGSLTAREKVTVGYYQYENGLLVHSGGRLVTGDLVMAQGTGSSGSYELSGDAELEAVAGTLGVWSGPAVFTQTGGTATFSQVLYLTTYYGTNNDATYTLSGGKLTANIIYINGNDSGGDGLFEITDAGAEIEITDSFNIQAKGTFHAVPGTVIHLKHHGGFAVEKDTSAGDLGDLDNLTLVFSTQPGPSAPHGGEIEVFAEDTGLDGLDSSPRFGTVTLSRGARVCLFNNFNNAVGSPVQALYVRDLNLSKGSTLDLNGYNIYCECFLNMGGTVDDSKGGSVIYENECHVFTIEADPVHLHADGVSTSEITSTLIVDGVAEVGRPIRFYTDRGLLTDGVTTDTSLLAVTDSDGRASVELIADDSGTGTAAVNAEVPDWDWTTGCEVEIIDYHIWTTAEKAVYTRIPGRVAPYELTFPNAMFSSSTPMPTLYGETRIPVSLRVEGMDVAGVEIELSSEMGDRCGIFQIDYPFTVFTEADGTAEFTLIVDNPYLTLVTSSFDMEDDKDFVLDLTLQVVGHPGSKKTMEFPILDNYQILFHTFEENLPDGHIWNLSDPFNAIQYPAYWPLIVSGVWAGVANNILDMLWWIEYKTTGLRQSPYGPFTCGCYQLMVLELLDKIRLEMVSGKSAMLLNGFHYGPVKVLWGGHQAAMIWPGHRVWHDPAWTHVWDPWIPQYPEGASYTLAQWMEGMGIVIPAFGWLFNLFLEPGSSNGFAQSYYPPNSGISYPADINPGTADCGGERLGHISLVLHCPVDLMVTDDQGRRAGLLPNTPEGECPYLNEIPGAEFYPQLLLDGSRAFLLEIPRQNLIVDILGNQSGDFSAAVYIADEPGKVIHYTAAAIQKEQSAQLFIDPNAVHDPVMVYDNGDLILPDETLSLSDLGYDETTDQTSLRISMTNRTDHSFHTPLRIVLDQVDPGAVTPVSWDGVDSQGKPYLDLSGDLTEGRLDPGQSFQRTVFWKHSQGNSFHISLSLTGQTATGGALTARRTNFKLNQPLCGKHYFITPPKELTENNASDWYCWADEGNYGWSYLENDPFWMLEGASSIIFNTDGAFDTLVRYPETYEARWDLSDADFLTLSLYADNPNELLFQSGPIVQLKKDADNYLEYVYYQGGQPQPVINEAVYQWQNWTIPLRANPAETDGWRLIPYGQADLSEIAYVEIHADTWDSGFVLWIDQVSFDLPEYRYRDFNCDDQVGIDDLAILAAQWLGGEGGFASHRATDLDQNCRVDLSDFASFAQQWLAGTSP